MIIWLNEDILWCTEIPSLLSKNYCFIDQTVNAVIPGYFHKSRHQKVKSHWKQPLQIKHTLNLFGFVLTQRIGLSINSALNVSPRDMLGSMTLGYGYFSWQSLTFNYWTQSIFAVSIAFLIVKFFIHYLNFLMFWNRSVVNSSIISTVPVREEGKRHKWCFSSLLRLKAREVIFREHNGKIK